MKNFGLVILEPIEIGLLKLEVHDPTMFAKLSRALRVTTVERMALAIKEKYVTT